MSKRILPFMFLVLYVVFCLLSTINDEFIVAWMVALGGYIVSLIYVTKPTVR